MQKINSINFKGHIYYTKVPLISTEINDELPYEMIEQNPSQLLKEVVENSIFFKDLKTGTDVFVSSNIDTYKKPFFGVIKALFKDPYHPQQEAPDEVNLQTIGFSKDMIFEKLKIIANGLPCYNKLKGNEKVGSIIDIGNKFDDTDGYIAIGV